MLHRILSTAALFRFCSTCKCVSLIFLLARYCVTINASICLSIVLLDLFPAKLVAGACLKHFVAGLSVECTCATFVQFVFGPQTCT